MQTLSTRVPEEVLTQFDLRAAELGKSRGEHLRDLVVDHVMSDGADPEREELTEVRRELRSLRALLKTSVAGLLANLGQYDPADAEEWVRHHLRE